MATVKVTGDGLDAMNSSSGINESSVLDFFDAGSSSAGIGGAA